MRLFGTDGIRGTVNRHPMTPESVLRVGMATARVLMKDAGKRTVLIGKDTRLSGYLIESALTAGLCSMGMNVTLAGPVPTPGVAYLTRALGLDAGIVISASHNPFNDNGIKIFSSKGLKLPDHMEREIEALAKRDSLRKKRPTGGGIGKAFRLDDAVERYTAFLKSTAPRGLSLKGIKAVVDCANGAAYRVTPEVLRELGAQVVTINDTPNGVNINEGCGSLYPEVLIKAVLSEGADVGIAHDGDADRTLFADEKGNLVDGDHVIGMCAVDMKKSRKLRNNTAVATVMSNLGLEDYLGRHHIRLVRTRVGDRYVTEQMLQGGYNLGGEQSGHIIFLDRNTTGDGPLTALQVLALMKKRGAALSELASEIKLYPQILINVKVGKKGEFRKVPEIKEAVKKAEAALGDTGRVLVRPSGTEPKVRVMLEGRDKKLIEKLGRSIVRVVKRTMPE